MNTNLFEHLEISEQLEWATAPVEEMDDPYYLYTTINGKQIKIDSNYSERYCTTGMTGSGKTNTIHNLCALYHKKKWKLVIIDAKPEYYKMKFKGERSDWYYAIDDLRVMIPHSLYDERKKYVPFAERFALHPSDLEAEDYIGLLGYTSAQGQTIYELSKIANKYKPYTIEDFMGYVNKHCRGNIRNFVLSRMYELNRLKVVSTNGIRLKELLTSKEPVVFEFARVRMESDIKAAVMQGLVKLIVRKESHIKSERRYKKLKFFNVFDEVKTLLEPKDNVAYKAIGDLLSLGRQDKISTAISTQYPLVIPKEFYENCGVKIFHKTTSPTAKKYIASTLGISDTDLNLHTLDVGDAVVLDRDGRFLNVHVPLSPVGKLKEGEF